VADALLKRTEAGEQAERPLAERRSLLASAAMQLLAAAARSGGHAGQGLACTLLPPITRELDS
jgi:hypothetical protein